MASNYPNPPIFLNYRRRDGAGIGHANTLRVKLEAIFGQGAVFQDNFTIQSGEEWEERIPRGVKQAKVFLALIHSDEWFTGAEELDKFGNTERLLFQKDDWVCKEIVLALQKKEFLIIPIRLPRVSIWPKDQAERLKAAPPEMEPFFAKQFLHFDPDKLEASLEALAKRIASVIPLPTSPPPSFAAEPVEPDLLAFLPLDPDLVDGLCHQEAPYVGSTHFEERHAPLFFGREADVLSLYEEKVLSLKSRQVLLFYGASGVGKSSLLHAGLFPRLKYQGWYVGYHRREKATGLSAGLAELVEGALQSSAAQKLLLLDQVEEMYTDPMDEEMEPAANGGLEAKRFFDDLHGVLSDYADLKVVLSFRKEYLAEVKDGLKDRGINFLWQSLRPLSESGIRRAIHGVFRDPDLKAQFENLESLDPLLEEALLADILCDEASNIAPLLQFQLRTVWDEAKKASAGGPIHLKKDHYQGERSLQDFLENHKLATLQRRFPEAARSGLLDDVLYFYTTPDHTAASRTDSAFFQRYSHIRERWPELLSRIQQSLIDEYLLIYDREERKGRLAHDSLAKIVRARFENSPLPGQQAFHIVHAKEIADNQQYAIDFSETDIAIIEEGQWGMPCLSARMTRKIKADKEKYTRQKQDRLNLALANAHSNIEHLQFEEALKNLQIASLEKLADNRIPELAWQLPFPLQQLKKESAWKEALAFLKGEDPDPDLDRMMRERFFPAMVEIKTGGKPYSMGSTEGFARERPVHEVTVSDFLLGATPVTFWQYGLFCKITGWDLPNDSGFGRGDKPAINLNWFEAVKYCNWLTEWLSPLDGVELEKVYAIDEDQVTADWSKNGFRLPTEAEWEYAAREGGREVRFGNGKEVADPAEMNFNAAHQYNEHKPEWYVKGQDRKATTSVTEFAPNRLGLYDMSGNVYEWCWDWWSEGEKHYYKQSEGAHDPTGPETGDHRMVRGGSWNNSALNCRCAFRFRYHPLDRNNYVGFRVARRR